MPVSLDELEAAYRRVSRSLYRAQEDALDFAAEEIVATLERQQTIIDAAFFILIFGQVEARINGLAAARLPGPISGRPCAIRPLHGVCRWRCLVAGTRPCAPPGTAAATTSHTAK